MRRGTAVILALLVCGAAMTMVMTGSALRRAPVVARAFSRVLTQTLARPCRLSLAPAAMADELKDWQPVAPESTGSSGARTRTHRASTATRGVTRAPIPPAAPPTDSLVPIEPSGAPTLPRGPGHSGEMMRIGSDIHIESDQTVTGDVVAISGDVTVDGHVKGDVMAMRGNVYLNETARVDGDVVCLGGELDENPGASVGGQRVTALGGRRMRNFRGEHTEMAIASNLSRFIKTLLWMLINLGAVWLIVKIAPGRSAQALGRLRHETAASLGIGLLSWVLLVPSLIALCLVVAILCITIIGIPVAIAALFAYFILVVVLVAWGSVVGAAWLGEQIAGRGQGTMTLMRAAVIGIILIVGGRAMGHLIHAVPWFHLLGGFVVVVSWITAALATTLGTGALLRSEFAGGGPGQWWRGIRAPRGGTPAPAAAGAASGSVAAPFTAAPAAPVHDAGATYTATPGPSSYGAAPPAPPVNPYAPPPSEGG